MQKPKIGNTNAAMEPNDLAELNAIAEKVESGELSIEEADVQMNRLAAEMQVGAALRVNLVLAKGAAKLRRRRVISFLALIAIVILLVAFKRFA